MHYFPGLDQEKILWSVSYVNLNMYLATIPSYETDKEPEQATKDKAKTDKQREIQQMNEFFKRF